MKYITELKPNIIDEYRNQIPPWGPIGYTTYKRTYARRNPIYSDTPTEEWYETVFRCINGLLEIGAAFTEEEARVFYHYMYNLKCIMSGRGLWQLGTETVRRIGGDSLQACWHIAVNEPIHPFTFNFDELMLGGGVGFNILPENVYALPIVKYSPKIERVLNSFDVDYIVSDNREGWIELLKRILEAYFFTGKNLSYNTDCIRDKGRPIVSFGGTASGPENLVEGLTLICKVLDGAIGRKLKPIECMDIMNILGMIVVAGNVRRSAQIACGSGQDREFLLAKYWHGNRYVPKWRQQSNNTVITDNLKELLPEFWWGYEVDEHGNGKGEALGLFNPTLVKNYGRLVDGFRYKTDDHVSGPNPCGEANLESDESCNLGELFLTNLTGLDEFRTAAGLLYKAQKAVSCMRFNHPRTTAVVAKNHRLGISVTGFTAAHHLRNPEYFNHVYKFLEDLDRRHSKVLNTTPSNKLTMVKPSGTAAKLANGCPPGANGAFARYQIIRMTFASDNPLVEEIREHGYNVVPKINIDGSVDYNSVLAEFPVSYPEGVPTDSELTAKDQMNNQHWLQSFWADNSVSMTVQYKPEELESVQDYLNEHYTESIKAISFCRHFHGFKQMPNEEITLEEYNRLKENTRPINQLKSNTY